jgi:hypothetical protein
MSTDFAVSEGSPDLAMSDPLPLGDRPTRAELRRQREALEAASAPAVYDAGSDQPQVSPTRAERRRAQEAGPSARSRAELRELTRKEAKQRGPLRTLLTAWWVYPLVGLVVFFVYLGVKSSQPPAAPPGVEVTTPTPIP